MSRHAQTATLRAARPNLLVIGRAIAVLSLLVSGIQFLPMMAHGQGPSLKSPIELRGTEVDRRFDGIGIVDGGGATSVLLKDYPEPQRSQILDLLYKPKFGASVGALLLEIPGDGNSTQGTMPSHMHTREDLNFHRGYTWWIAQQAKMRNPNLTLTGMAWSAPGWVGHGNFWSADTVDYYIKWLQGLRDVYKLNFNAIGLRNEKGVDFPFAEAMRKALNQNGFRDVNVQGFDNWTPTKLDFVKEMFDDPAKRDAIDILSAHTLVANPATEGPQIRNWAAQLHKKIWNSEEHVYKSGFDCEISIVQEFNLNYIRYGTSLVVNWYGIAGVYPIEPYSETPAALLARSPWSGSYSVREALWGYAHYGQFAAPGWSYLRGGSGELAQGGTYVSLKSPDNDYSIIIETKDAKTNQLVTFRVMDGLSTKDLHVWKSDASAQFIEQKDIHPTNGIFSIEMAPETIVSLTTTGGQQKGAFPHIPSATPFPLPYSETFDEYTKPADYGYLPHYTADIDGVFEIAPRPDGKGQTLHQVVSQKPISWAPEWLPYTIIGDDKWSDYEVASDIYLNDHDSAGIMGRVINVGTGYGTIPRGYYFMLAYDGSCRLAVMRGKADKHEVIGDAEQQALIKANREFGPGGEIVLGTAHVSQMQAHQWHRLKLSFRGQAITASVDGIEVLHATDPLYSHGMAGLVAGATDVTFSTPYFDNVSVVSTKQPEPGSADNSVANRRPIY